MSNRKVLRQIAKEHGISLKEVKQDMQAALAHAYKNAPKDGVTKAYQDRVPRKGEIPTAEEFINYAVMEIKKKDKDLLKQ